MSEREEQANTIEVIWPSLESGATYQAENAFFYGGVTVNTTYMGFSGSGYLSNIAAVDDKVIFVANTPAAGNYSVTLRYANGNSSDKTLSIYVNGIFVLQTSFAPTGNWDKWAVRTETLPLRAGVNTITYLHTSADSGNVNLDYINIPKAAPNASRGATLPYIEYKAVDGTTNAAITPEDRTYRTIASEAFGRKAVKLAFAGDYVQITLTAPANSLVIRYCIPDAENGGGITAPLSLYINGTKSQDILLSSRHSWLYGKFPWSVDPSQGLPHRFFEEVRIRTGKLETGTTIKLQKDLNDNADYCYIDLIDAEEVAPALTIPQDFLSIDSFGAVESSENDDTDAINRCIEAAKAQGKGVWIPEGTFNCTSGKITVPNGMVIRGAGMWYSTLNGKYAGFMINGNAQFYDFAIYGDEVTRDDTGGTAGIEGNGTNSVIQNIWFEHLKVGMWFNAATDGVYVEGVRVRDTYADGINAIEGTTNLMVENCDFRYTGDDGVALWSTGAVNNNCTVRFNTVKLPWLANCIAVYGGHDITVSDNICYDSIAFGGGINISSNFNPVGFSGTLTVTRNTLMRCSGYENDYDYPRGAIWVYAVKNIDAAITVSDMQVIDSTFQGISIEGSGIIKNLIFTDIKIIKCGTYGIDIRSDAAGTATFNAVRVSEAKSGELVNSLDQNFIIKRGYGNMGW